jgi:uncharacterized membrane protein YagU involved in acid resistance
MEIVIPNSTGYNNYRSTIYCSMAKQKLELTFWNGVVLGAIVTFFLLTGIIGQFFVSKDVFKLKNVYVDGKMYKIVEDR